MVILGGNIIIKCYEEERKEIVSKRDEETLYNKDHRFRNFASVVEIYWWNFAFILIFYQKDSLLIYQTKNGLQLATSLFFFFVKCNFSWLIVQPRWKINKCQKQSLISGSGLGLNFCELFNSLLKRLTIKILKILDKKNLENQFRNLLAQRSYTQLTITCDMRIELFFGVKE